MVILTMVILTMVILTMVILTVVILTVVILTMVLLTMVILTMERACMMMPRSSSSSSVTGSSTVRGSSRALAIMRRSLGRVSWLGVEVGVGVGERWVGDHVPQ